MINIPKGTKDVLPVDSYKWQYIEKTARETAHLCGFKEIRTPVFEHTELFARGVGETTDIVNKEMYTFLDRGERSITLKPEGTAGVCRSFIENNLQNQGLPQKMYYFTPVFRYERPQSGRLREHHQFGVELFGSFDAAADAEVISLAYDFLTSLQISRLKLYINSIGCPDCRKDFNAVLKTYLSKHKEALCPDCAGRMDKNTLRVLDCKVESCKKIVSDAPDIAAFLCHGCKGHFDELKTHLDSLKIEYFVNNKLVRGLDYYTRTVFEFITDAIGSQGTVCGGGRYDNLISSLGGTAVPAVGFGLGLERLLLLMENLGAQAGGDSCVKLFLGYAGSGKSKTMELAGALRKAGIATETELLSRSVKSQMKYADKIKAEYSAVLGDDEIKTQTVNLKNMADGSVKIVKFSELADKLK